MKPEVKYVAAGKSSQLVSQIKPILTDQNHRLSSKHHTDIDLIDDLRTFIKVKCNIERDYATALIKLINSHQKKYPSFAIENDSDTKSLYTSWKSYLEEVEKNAKQRVSEYEQVSHSVDSLKELKSHKVSIGKRTLDQHLKKMHEEVIHSVTDLDKNRKVYQEDEHFAKQARDKEEKLMKKKSAGIFAKLTDLQSKKEKTSSHREATEIQSTQARNEYIMALASTNAHLHHFYSLDLPTLMTVLDDDSLSKCRLIILTMIQKDLTSLSSLTEGVTRANSLVSATSADFTNKAFLSESASSCLSEEIQIEFEACENDTVRTISTEHNADLALQHDITKWLTCFQKECRNLCRLNTQLIKCQNLAQQGHKTVEVRGVGQVNLETQIEEVKQQIRKCDISKAKAYARLLAIREGGMEMEDLITLEANIKSEMKAAASTLDVDPGHMALSRTPSVKSTQGSDGRGSGMDKSFSEDDTNHTPEPEQYVRDSYEQDDSENERDTPYLNQYSNQYASSQANAATAAGPGSGSGWSADWGDPAAAWTEASLAPAAATAVPEPVPVPTATQAQEEQYTDEYNESLQPQEGSGDQVESTPYEEYGSNEGEVDGTLMVGKLVRAIYAYAAQNSDELDLNEDETLTVISASDKDWVNAQNANGQIGFVPAAYLEVVGDAPPAPTQEEYEEEVVTFETNFAEEEISFPPPSIAEISSKGQEAPEVTYDNDGDEGHQETGEGDFVRALYDYEATNQEEISFSEGDLIRIIERSEDGWWTGEKDGVIGHFPSMLVSELDEDHEGEDEEDEGEEEEEEGEDENEDQDGAAFPNEDENEDEDGSPGSVKAAETSEGTKGPPPSFAPPKPINLIPQQIVIMQPTPEIESRGTFGEEVDQVEQNDDSANETTEATADANNNNKGGVDDEITNFAPPPPPPPPPVDPDFKLDQPPRPPPKEASSSSTAVTDLPPPPTPDELAMVGNDGNVSKDANGRPIPDEPTVQPPSPPEPGEEEEEETNDEPPLPPPPGPSESNVEDISDELVAEPHILDDVKEEEEPEEEPSKDSSSSTETEVEINQPNDTDEDEAAIDAEAANEPAIESKDNVKSNPGEGSDSEPDLK